MKNTKDKKGLRLIKFICLTVIALWSSSVNAAESVVVYNANSWDVFSGRTKAQIVSKYNNVMNNLGTYSDYTTSSYYSVPYNDSSTYVAGKLTNDTHKVMTNMSNYYRWLAGVTELDSVSVHKDDLQAGALVRSIYFDATHKLTHFGISDSYKPSGMNTTLWNTGKSVNHNILAWGYTPLGSITGWMNEGYDLSDNSFDTIGHRFMIMGSPTKHIDYGYVKKLAIGRISEGYSDSKVYSAYPSPGLMPLNGINVSESAWHIEFNESKIRVDSNVSVTVTNLGNGSSYTCTKADCLSLYEYDWDNNTIVFKQPTSSNNSNKYVDGDKFRVEVYGLTDVASGKSAKAVYETEFFDLNNPVEVEVSNISVTPPTKTTYKKGELGTTIDTSKLNLAGGKMVVSFTNNTSKQLDLNSSMIYSSSVDGSVLHVKFTYDNKAAKAVNVDFLIVDNPTQMSSSYGKTLGDVTLPISSYGTYSWVSPLTTSVGSVGTHEFGVKFTPKDSKYSSITNLVGKIVVSKANPTYELPTNLTVERNKKLKNITLPSGFSWKYPETSVGDIGTKQFVVVYTPSDTNNYNVVEALVDVVVTKAIPQYTVPSFTATYGDTLASLAIPVAENGVFTFNSPLTTSVGGAGVQKVMMTFTPNDTTNYEIVRNIEATINVNKALGEAVVTPTVPEMTYSPSVKLENIALPSRWSWDNKDIVPTVGNTGYKATYTPADPNNYDYSAYDLNPTISIVVNKAVPVYSAPVLVSYKFKTLADVELPTDTNGVYSWQDPLTTSVGEIGTRTFLVTYTPNDTNNYEIVRDIVATIEVGKAIPSYTVPTNLTATYGDLLSSIELPLGFTWNSPESLVGNAGVNGFYATFTPEDTDNYATITNVLINVNVKKKVADLISVPVLDEITYNPNFKLSNITLPSGWVWDDGDIVPTVDVDAYRATYTPVDANNYDYSGQDLNPYLTLKVNKVNPSYEIPTNVIAYWNDNLSDVNLPIGFTIQGSGKVGEIGIHTFKVTYTPNDTVNYNIIRDIEIEVVVLKAYPTDSITEEMTVDYKEGMKLNSIPLAKGWTWDRPDELIGNGGLFAVTFTPKDEVHYNKLHRYIRIVVRMPQPATPVQSNQGSYFNNSYSFNSSLNNNSNDNTGTMSTVKDDKTVTDKKDGSSDKKKDKKENKNDDDDDDDDEEESKGSNKVILIIIGIVTVAGIGIVIAFMKFNE